MEDYFLITLLGVEDGGKKQGADKTNSVGKGALSLLTPSEMRVAQLLGEGYTYKQIAGELTLSYHTVKKHVENIYAKLEISSRYQLYELMK